MLEIVKFFRILFLSQKISRQRLEDFASDHILKLTANNPGGIFTGLLTAVRFIKDNRLLPKGFDKRTAEQMIAPQGGAMNDADFMGGGDKIRYSVPLGNAQGPYQVEAEFWFQPISYRWANNLKPYNAMEPQRFTGYYDAMSSGSGVMLVRATAAK